MINSRRREERIAAKLPVRVWGMDANGTPFSVATTTLDITRSGARLKLDCPLKQGDIVGVQHGVNKARFRVAWVGQFGTTRLGQVGLVCIEPDKYIWGIPLNDLKPTAAAGAGTSHAAPPDRNKNAQPKRGSLERRDSSRYPCNGGAEFKNVEGGFLNWGIVTDISRTGCYVETNFPLADKQVVDLKVTVRNVDIRSRAIVRSSHPNVGMGLEFLQLSPEDKQRLDVLVASFGPAPSIVPRPPATPIPSPGNTRPAPAFVSKAPDASGQLREATSKLLDAEAIVAASALLIEPGVLADLGDAVLRTQRTIAATQDWLRSGNVDPSKLAAARHAARVRNLTMLANELRQSLNGTASELTDADRDALIQAIESLRNQLRAGLPEHDDKTVAPLSPS